MPPSPHDACLLPPAQTLLSKRSHEGSAMLHKDIYSHSA